MGNPVGLRKRRIAHLVCEASVATLGLLGMSHQEVLANTYGNTDAAEQSTNLVESWWGGASAPVNQRYGCTMVGYPEDPPPAPGSGITCPSPYNQGWHQGVDIGMVSTTLYSQVEGTVRDFVQSCLYAGCGLGRLAIQTDDGRIVYMLHGSPTNNLYLNGPVHVGDTIYTTGNNGPSSGYHLHFEVHRSQYGLSTLTCGSEPTGSPGSTCDDINPDDFLTGFHPLATTSRTSTSVEAFVRGTDMGAWQYWLDSSGVWHGPQSLGSAGGGFDSQVGAASIGSNHEDIFGTGSDGYLYQRYWTASQGWSSWQQLTGCGGGFQGAPAAVWWSSTNESVFVRGRDSAGATLIHCYWTGSQWIRDDHGGHLTADPTVVSTALNSLDVFVLGDSGTTYHQSWTAGGGWNTGSATSYDNWGTYGSGFRSPPVATVWGTGGADAFATTADGSMLTRHYNGALGRVSMVAQKSHQ